MESNSSAIIKVNGNTKIRNTTYLYVYVERLKNIPWLRDMSDFAFDSSSCHNFFKF